MDLLVWYRKVQSHLHELRYLFWECTLRCNLKCLHCGSDCRVASETADMPLEHFLNVLDEISGSYMPAKVVIAVTGGEPLLRQDLARCGKEFSKRGFPWGMVSNGYALTEARFRELRDSGLGSLTISLDGLEESHNWLRGNQDSFRRACAAIQMAAADSSLMFDVVTCVNQRNFPELERVKALLTGLGVRRWRLFAIFPKGRAHAEPLLDVTNEQFAALMEFIKETREQGVVKASSGCEGFLGPYEGEVRDGFFWCRAGTHAGSVLADGGISACPSLRGDYVQGNIYRDSFIDCWQNRFGIMRDRTWTRTGACAVCAVYKWCEGNGLHLRDGQSGSLLRCHFQMLADAGAFSREKGHP